MRLGLPMCVFSVAIPLSVRATGDTDANAAIRECVRPDRATAILTWASFHAPASCDPFDSATWSPLLPTADGVGGYDVELLVAGSDFAISAWDRAQPSHVRCNWRDGIFTQVANDGQRSVALRRRPAAGHGPGVLDTLNLSMLVDGFLFQTPGTLGRLAEQGLLELVAETDEFIDFRCAGHDFLAGQLLTGRLDRARGNLPVQLHLRLADGVHTQEYRVLDALQIGSAFVPSHAVIAWYNGTVETFVQEIIATSWQATPDLPDAALHIELPDRSAAITDSVAGYYTELGPAGELLQREALAAATGNEQPVVARAAGVPFISMGTISAAAALTVLLFWRRRRVR